jgi:NACalpha-BTF3-like transcription factor
MVGADAEAEAVWYEAINDPNLSRNARKDLIEDLNEEGFEDRKQPTEDDVQLIVRRLALIEELAPDAMDEINAAAFEEAYKDLVNMLQKAVNM